MIVGIFYLYQIYITTDITLHLYERIILLTQVTQKEHLDQRVPGSYRTRVNFFNFFKQIKHKHGRWIYLDIHAGGTAIIYL